MVVLNSNSFPGLHREMAIFKVRVIYRILNMQRLGYSCLLRELLRKLLASESFSNVNSLSPNQSLLKLTKLSRNWSINSDVAFNSEHVDVPACRVFGPVRYLNRIRAIHLQSSAPSVAQRPSLASKTIPCLLRTICYE